MKEEVKQKVATVVLYIYFLSNAFVVQQSVRLKTPRIRRTCNEIKEVKHTDG